MENKKRKKESKQGLDDGKKPKDREDRSKYQANLSTLYEREDEMSDIEEGIVKKENKEEAAEALSLLAGLSSASFGSSLSPLAGIIPCSPPSPLHLRL